MHAETGIWFTLRHFDIEKPQALEFVADRYTAHALRRAL